MPVKLRKPKGRAAQITDEARTIFAEAVTLQPIYHGCNRMDGTCRSTAVNRHCAECENYLSLSRELGRLVGTKPWETSPLNADHAEPPDYLRHNALQSEYWRKAWAIRREILATKRTKSK
ncbi:hypothetical protein JQ609_04260 [Bradyrhizobium sp. AUGA SZCCT0169]|uniref:hypothetical protein n=1 Tax=Bradyrhizobium sp. AUGA SZCCT0169 TaxID=2807663 RepID=UPI001BAA55C0|nr:hypothetical protein [Bradyrhizobium sp. AUGA SZCCT0169]MBR1246142.1 hypothetical protein [Bradyrhizobium sp. AUGA SZCCT0169]